MPDLNIAHTLDDIKSLKLRLLVLLAAALTPILLFAAAQSVVEANKAKTERRDTLLRVGDNAIDKVEQALDQAQILLEIFQPNIEARYCKRTLSQIQKSLPLISNIVQFDADGNTRCSAKVSEDDDDIHNPSLLIPLKNGQEIYNSNTFFGEEREAWFYSILRRSENEAGEFAGASLFDLSITGFVRLMADYSIPEEFEIALTDGRGRIFGSDRFTKIDPSWIKDVEQSSDGHLFHQDERDGKNYDVVIRDLGETKVYALISAPSPGLWSKFSISPATSIGLPLLSFSVALLVIWLSIDHLILRWLPRLRALSAAYGRGAYEIEVSRFEKAPGEIVALANAMEDMADKIASRDNSLKEAISARDAAFKEIHHRVKNNLQIVTSFLNLQSRQIKDPIAREALMAARHRIDALSVVHQTLYLNEQLTTVDMKPFLEGLLSHLSDALGLETLDVELHYDIASVSRDTDDAIPIALFVMEAITNSTKYAFNQSGGHIHVSLEKTGENDMKLTVQDDGTSSLKSHDEQTIPAGTGLGTKLMNAFAKQLRGKFKSGPRPEGGYFCELDTTATT